MINNWRQLSEHKIFEASPAEIEMQQNRWLFACMEHNKNTRYGRKYHFDSIASIEDYRKNVPLVRFEDIDAYIKLIERGEADVLFSGRAIAFERSSGSSGKEKLIPYSTESLRDFRIAILPWLSALARQFDISSGSAYWAVSPATRQEEYTSGGIPVGMPDTAYLGEELMPFFAGSSAVPHWVAGISEIQDWQLATLYYLLSRNDLVMISVWSPTFLLLLIEALSTRRDELAELLKQGGERCGHALAANASAYNRLTAYLDNKEVKTLWPELRVISCWSDASSKPFYQTLQMHLPGVAFQAKGLLSTEGVVTVPDRNNKQVLAMESGFFEFLDQRDCSKLAHELAAGNRYQVVMTTSGGLYRYRTGDHVICEGYQYGKPVLRFVGRGDLTSDMTGEKLTEEFVCSCLEDVSGFRMLIPSRHEKPCYLLALDRNECREPENVSNKVEKRLMDNPQYAYARKLGQLGSLRLLLLDKPLQHYINSSMHGSTRLGDRKAPALCTKTGWLDI
ncbi:MAG: GH3 auxin-responsive promoter family protein [Gammaproteobacteria bacterium]|nr:GH3 auxin-responsive promoter family protein [Gammaproteobacteria bacterium]